MAFRSTIGGFKLPYFVGSPTRNGNKIKNCLVKLYPMIDLATILDDYEGVLYYQRWPELGYVFALLLSMLGSFQQVELTHLSNFRFRKLVCLYKIFGISNDKLARTSTLILYITYK